MIAIELDEREYELFKRGAAAVNKSAYMIASHPPTAYERRLYDYYRGFVKKDIIDIHGENEAQEMED